MVSFLSAHAHNGAIDVDGRILVADIILESQASQLEHPDVTAGRGQRLQQAIASLDNLLCLRQVCAWVSLVHTDDGALESLSGADVGAADRAQSVAPRLLCVVIPACGAVQGVAVLPLSHLQVLP